MFVDASCRREPDFEAAPPTISAVCRERFFAPRLRRHAVVVYLTKAGRYPGSKLWAYRLVAVLQVARPFDSHEAAARWFEEQRLPLPSNCLVPGNEPLQLDHTAHPRWDLSEWDAKYQDRVRHYPAFLVCRSLFLELRNPPILTPAQVAAALGANRPRTPVPYRQDQVERLLASAGVKLSFVEQDLEPSRGALGEHNVTSVSPPPPTELRGDPTRMGAERGGYGAPVRLPRTAIKHRC